MPPADGLPLVSCIMPTYNRRRFVPSAIRYFLRQDFPNKELVIVDDGTDAVGDLVPSDSRVRYVQLSRRATVGAKRNLACEQSAGSLIAHWDDDDWHGSNRLRCQVKALLGAEADLCGLKTLLFYDTRNGQAWRYTYPDGQRAWLSGGSLLYTRAFWAGHRFPEHNVGEDAHFVWSADPQRMVAVPDFAIYVCIIHGENTSPKQTGGAWWRPHPVEEVSRVLGKDWGDYQRGEPPFAPKPVVVEARIEDSVATPPSLRNVFACLVHENPECIIDLVCNLRHLDPTSAVLLYNGGKNPQLLDGAFPFNHYGATVHPTPRPMSWGRLHDFALDCMRFALQEWEFDTLTIVDSDQLALRSGYSAHLAAFLAEQRGVGMLGNSPNVETAATRIGPARAAHAEIELWRPFLKRFRDGEPKFVHWSFWPSTVFTLDAVRALVKLLDQDTELQHILRHTRVWATEEVILPTLIALLGFRVVANPCNYDYVKFRARYSVQQLDAALDRPDVFWVHPIPRRSDDPLRQHIRGRFNNYGKPEPTLMEPEPPETGLPSLLLSRSLLSRIKKIEGWLDEDEADLLIGVAVRALSELPQVRAVVEVGSYCGRGTVVLGSVAKAMRPTARVWAIDPHDGKLGTAEQCVTVTPSLEKLKTNVVAAGLTDTVEIVQSKAPQVAWKEPIALLLIDGLHDYASVAQDFRHFEPWGAEGGYVAFHDYAGYFPGVVTFVNELLASGRYRRAGFAGSLIVLWKAPLPAPGGDE
jgi:hypothetical protein